MEFFGTNLADKYLMYKKNEAEARRHYFESVSTHNRKMIYVLISFLVGVVAFMSFLTIYEKVSGDAEVRPSWKKLLSYYGDCVKSCVLENKRKLMLYDFCDSSGKLDREKIRDLSSCVINYQKNRVNDGLGALQRFYLRKPKLLRIS